MPALPELQAFLRNRPYERALPSSLPHDWLLAVCDDLRKVSATLGTDNPASLSDERCMARPLLLIVHILDARAVAASIREVAYAMNDMPELLKRYQVLCEQEVVNRAAAVRPLADDEGFLAYVDRKVRIDAVR